MSLKVTTITMQPRLKEESSILQARVITPLIALTFHLTQRMMEALFTRARLLMSK